MATVLKAGNVTTGGSFTPDNTGILEIKTGTGAGTTAVTVSTGQVVTLANALPIASGGTGQTSYTNGQLLIGNSTGNTLTKTTLTEGSGITITNGAGSITIAASGGGSNTQMSFASYPTTVFNSTGTPMANTGTGTFNWTCPTGVTKVMVSVIAGGGGTGDTASGSPETSTWGGVGGTAIGIYTVTPGTVYSVTVGVGGTAAPTGGTGGSSSFSTFATATGGTGGLPAGSGNGTGGTGSSGNLKNSSSTSQRNFYISTHMGFLGNENTAGFPVNEDGATTAATNWSTSTRSAPGAGGAGSTRSVLNGGVSGIVLITWVG